MGSFATGVAIVTAASGGELVGVTANSFSSLSLDPPLILWSLRKQSTSLSGFRAASHFAVNILSADQVHLASRFATAGDNKFGSIKWRPGLGGAPVLFDTVAAIECRSYRIDQGGDHVILIGQVEAFSTSGLAPLAFVRGKFSLTSPHPAAQTVSYSDPLSGWG
jgi:flavin reductase (DIM6/NTAB) family NADH-FMN oxidoreductase RutF